MAACALLALGACSSDDTAPASSTDAANCGGEDCVAVDTVAKTAGGESVDDSNGLGRLAGDPNVGRSAGEPGQDAAPLLHVLGSIRSVADSTATFGDDAEVVRNDLATIASVGCAPSDCPVTALAPWASGQIEVLNIATGEAASEGADELGAYVTEFREAGITTLGYGNTISAAIEPVIVRNGNNRVAIHSITLDPDNTALATDDTPGLAGVTALDSLRQAVIANRNNGLGVVVLVDWGGNALRSPSPEQVIDVEQLVDAGADAIIGHGSDFLLRFDLVGQTAVAYGLGNASITAADPLRADTAILRLEFDTPGRSCLLPATAGPSGPSLDDPTDLTCRQG